MKPAFVPPITARDILNVTMRKRGATGRQIDAVQDAIDARAPRTRAEWIDAAEQEITKCLTTSANS